MIKRKIACLVLSFMLLCSIWTDVVFYIHAEEQTKVDDQIVSERLQVETGSTQDALKDETKIKPDAVNDNLSIRFESNNISDSLANNSEIDNENGYNTEVDEKNIKPELFMRC